MDGPVADKIKRWSKKHGKERISGGGGSESPSLKWGDFASESDNQSLHGDGMANNIDPEPCLADFATPSKSKVTSTRRWRVWGKSSPTRFGYSPRKRKSSPGAVCSPLSSSHLDLDDMLDASEQVPARPSYWSRGSRFAEGREENFRWECSHCPFVIEGSSSKTVCRARYSHN